MSMFSERFRQLKTESNMTLKELSEELDITVPNLSYYMKGREPSYNVLIRIADYFDVTTDWLIGRTDSKIPIYDSITMEIEKRVQVTNETRLNGWKRAMYQSDQDMLYNTMANTYHLFTMINCDNFQDVTKCIYSLSGSLDFFIEEMQSLFLDVSKDNLMEVLDNVVSISDATETMMLYVAYNLIVSLAESEEISEEDRPILLETVNYTYSFLNRASCKNLKEAYNLINKVSEHVEQILYKEPDKNPD